MIFKKSRRHKNDVDSLEQRFESMLELTRGVDEQSFEYLLDALQLVYDARQKLIAMQAGGDKDAASIMQAESQLELIEEGEHNGK